MKPHTPSCFACGQPNVPTHICPVVQERRSDPIDTANEYHRSCRRQVLHEVIWGAVIGILLFLLLSYGWAWSLGL